MLIKMTELKFFTYQIFKNLEVCPPKQKLVLVALIGSVFKEGNLATYLKVTNALTFDLSTPIGIYPRDLPLRYKLTNFF